MTHLFARVRPLLVTGAIFAAACDGGGGGTGPDPEPQPQPPAVGFALTADTVWLPTPGDTAHLEVRRADGQLTAVPELAWRTLESGVVSVSAHGVVTAQAPGVARVVAEARGAADTLTVKITKYVSLSVGMWSSCAVTEDGALHCWGANLNDVLLGQQLPAACVAGSTRFSCAKTPARVPGVPPMARAISGAGNNCAVTPAGQAWCWGTNVMGTAGTSSSPQPQAPKPLLGGLQVASMFLNGANCLLTPEGAAYCWGGGDFTGPQPVQVERRFSSYTTSLTHCGIERGTTRITCFGESAPESLGDHAWTQVIASWDHFNAFCGLNTAGAAWCWSTPGGLEKVSGDVVLAQITGGRIHRCGLAAAGQAFCWGWNDHGQLGRGTRGGEQAVDSVGGGHRFKELGAGDRHTCGLTTSGVLYCWGKGEMGELGDGFAVDHNLPVRVLSSRSPM